MAEPGDEIAAGAGGRGRMRASHADREQVVGTLKAAFVAGMLARDEFDLRVGLALASRTYAELDALTADLPAGLAPAPLPKPARAADGKPLLRLGPLVTWATVLYAAAWAFALSPAADNTHKAGALFVFGNLVYLAVMAIAVAAAFENRQDRRDRRTGGQLPPGQAPGAGGAPPRRLPPVGPGGQLPPADPGQRHTAEAARQRRPWPSVPVLGPCPSGALAARTTPAGG